MSSPGSGAVGIASASLSSCEPDAGKPIKAPVTPKITKVLEHFGDQRIDNYYWLRDDERADAKVLQHVDRENEYAAQIMEDTLVLQRDLFRELKMYIRVSI